VAKLAVSESRAGIPAEGYPLESGHTMGQSRWPRGLAYSIVLALGLGLGLSDAPDRGAGPGPHVADRASGPRIETVARGAAIYVSNCEGCHGDVNGVGKIREAPPHGPAGHSWGHPDGQLIEFILRGSPPRSADATGMPAWRGRLTESDAAAVVAFLKTWWSTEQNESRRRWYGCRLDTTPSC
jgi:mono/diheme cytochrome c family protein